MSVLEITASSLFATELFKAALPFVAKKYPYFRGVWQRQSMTMRYESSTSRVAEILVGFHNGLEVSGDCTVHKDVRGLWNAGKVRLTLPDKTTWELVGALNYDFVIDINKNYVRQL